MALLLKFYLKEISVNVERFFSREPPKLFQKKLPIVSTRARLDVTTSAVTESALKVGLVGHLPTSEIHWWTVVRAITVR